MKRVVIVGGGVAGLGAAYTLKKQGLTPVLLEAEAHVGGRLASDEVDGFLIDTRGDSFCHSYDAVFRICEEMDVPLVPTRQKLGWHRNGQWHVTTAAPSVSGVITNLRAFPSLGLLSWGAMKLVWRVFREADYLTFASHSRMAEIDRDESFGDYLARAGPRTRVSAGDAQGDRGEWRLGLCRFLRPGVHQGVSGEHVSAAVPAESAGEGADALAHALRDACAGVTRVSTPVRQVLFGERGVKGVVIDRGTIEADAVIRAVPTPAALEIIPGLPQRVRETLSNVTYSSACRLGMGLDHLPLPPAGTARPTPRTRLPSCWTGPSTCLVACHRGRARWTWSRSENMQRNCLNWTMRKPNARCYGTARRNPLFGSVLPGNNERLFARVCRWKTAVCKGPPGMLRAVASGISAVEESIALFSSLPA